MCARHLHAVAAQLVEQRLAGVRERRDLGEAEGGAAALDRMRDAEDRVDELRLGRADVELEQRGLHRVESFEALVEEGVVKLCEVERHDYLSSTRCTVAISCAGSNGLTIQPVAPAVLALALAVRRVLGRQHQDRRVAILRLGAQRADHLDAVA